MVKLDEALPSETAFKRVIGKIEGKTEGAVVLFFAGIHGNEPSGVLALQEVFKTLQKENKVIEGAVYAFSGNLPALLKGVRFIEHDLNRIWTKETLEKVLNTSAEHHAVEEKEVLVLYQLIVGLLEKHSGPFYFIDFHTTSSETIPFITISDSLINRKFSMLFSVPIVLGIEEYLEGALLSYANHLGYVALAFESGQHESVEAVSNTIAFIYLALVFCGCVQKEDLSGFEAYEQRLKIAAKGKHKVYEITGNHKINTGERFKMAPGFGNFESVCSGTVLAESNGTPIIARKRTTLFMPLYQNQGTEGFFLIRKIPNVFLTLSAWLRNSKVDGLLTLLPGVSWRTPKKEALYVNLKVARFLSKPFFHLLGYRIWKMDTTHVSMRNRERRAKTGIYKKTTWW